jgi:hypothetical protein
MLTTTDDFPPQDDVTPPRPGSLPKPAADAASDNASDPWADWKPDFRPGAPHALQERQARTAQVQHRGASAPESRRRITDARLWDAMSPQQQDAAREIAAVFESMSRGLGYAASDWARLPGARGVSAASDIQARLMTGYVEWTKRCHKAGVSHSMTIDILVFGHTCHALDRDRRAAAGWSKRNLLKALSLYCAVKGWPS